MPDLTGFPTDSWVVQTWTTPPPLPGPVTSPRQPATDVEFGRLLQLEFVLRTITELQQCPRSADACRMLANRLREFLGCRQVAIGLCRPSGRSCPVTGLSGVVQFDANTPMVRAVRDALEETVLRGTQTVWPPRDAADKHGARAHEKLLTLLGAECVMSLPLRGTDDRIVAVLLLLDEGAESSVSFLQQHASTLGLCLELLETGRGHSWSRPWRRAISWLMGHRGRAALLTIACVALLLAVPWPYTVSCPCQLQPVVRRFVVAPYDGTLAKSLVAPGDVVQQDQPLARMDQREIRWELAGLDAQLARTEKERDAALASHEVGTAQLHTLELERLRLKKQALEHRADNLDIKSPMAGIVVAGDLEKAEGAPLTIGQTLFEVAPLDRMVVEVHIPEENIAHVHEGMLVTISLDGLAERRLTGTISRVHPRAELRDQQSVFVAEVETDNAHNELRPGMNGQASVASGRRQLGWILFHRPWDSVRRMLAW